MIKDFGMDTEGLVAVSFIVTHSFENSDINQEKFFCLFKNIHI